MFAKNKKRMKVSTKVKKERSLSPHEPKRIVMGGEKQVLII